MSTKEFLDTLSVDQLDFAIDYAIGRLREKKETPREEYWCIGDDYINLAFFTKEDREKALTQFVKEFEGNKNRVELQLSLVKLRPDEVEGLLK